MKNKIIRPCKPWEIRVAEERGMNSGLLDARSYDSDPECFEETPNPYGVDTEDDLHEAWAVGYENTFEGSKTKP